MGVLEFQKLPVNTLVGADWQTFKGITQGQTIDKGYRTKYFLKFFETDSGQKIQ